MTNAPAPESVPFRAEIRQLLNILIHSLYTDREIFLRELISNASDALHRAQFEMLTNRAVLNPDAELAIRLSADKDAHTLTLSDSGIADRSRNRARFDAAACRSHGSCNGPRADTTAKHRRVARRVLQAAGVGWRVRC